MVLAIGDHGGSVNRVVHEEDKKNDCLIIVYQNSHNLLTLKGLIVNVRENNAHENNT